MHALGVEYTYKKQTACPGHFASVMLDFEPADAYTFVNALPADAMEYPDSQARFVPVVDETAHEQLENNFGAGPLPVRVTLRAARDHIVDSHDTSFRVATLWAVRRALERTGLHGERVDLEDVLDGLDPPDRVVHVRPILDDPRRCFPALDVCRDLVRRFPRDAADLLPALARLAGSPDDRVALRALRAMAGAPHDRTRDPARELIAEALSRPAGEARDQAVRTLAARGDPRAAGPLAEMLARDRLPKDIEWPVRPMKDHASVLLPAIRARLEAATPGALEPFLFELVCQVSHWGETAAPLAPSLRRIAEAPGNDRWTADELARALDRMGARSWRGIEPGGLEPDATP